MTHKQQDNVLFWILVVFSVYVLFLVGIVFKLLP